MTSLLLAAAFSFTATATGVEKGTPVEFFLAGRQTDRDYETLFLLEDSVQSFCSRAEKAGFPRGTPENPRSCQLWPTGVEVTIDPPLSRFLDIDMPEGVPSAPLIYTGGTRLGDVVEAETNMPAAVLSLFSLAQAPIVLNGIYEQGVVYNAFKAKETLKKGKIVKFILKWDDTTRPESLDLEFSPSNVVENLNRIKAAARRGEVVVRASFSDALTVSEAISVAQALATVDSARVKVNGRSEGNFFFRAFLPMIKWKDRKERLTQPFEITVSDTSPDRVVHVSEDWSVEGDDPKLTEEVVSYEQLSGFPKTDTVFFFASPQLKIGRLRASLARVPSFVFNHYVFVKEM